MATRTEHFDIPAPSITIRQIAGRVTIEPSASGRTEVLLTGSDAMVAAADIECSGHSITVVVAKPRRRRFGAIVMTREHVVDIHLRVASDASLRVATISGDVRVTGDHRETRYNSVSGDLHIHGDCVSAQINTVSGDVEFSGRFADMSAKSVSGDMSITAHRGGELALSSVSGNIDVLLASGLTIDIEAKSLSGDLRSQIALDQSDDFAAAGETLRVIGKTVSGNLHINRATTV